MAGFIRNGGVLERRHEHRTPEAYKHYRKRTEASSPDADASNQSRRDFAVADITPIEFIGVWDTVGALGIPLPFWRTLGAKKFLSHPAR